MRFRVRLTILSSCNPGYSFCVTDNAGTATYTNGDVYTVTMSAAQSQNTDFTCGTVGNDHEIKGSEIESCFSDFFFNCNSMAPCNLCDYRADCGVVGG